MSDVEQAKGRIMAVMNGTADEASCREIQALVSPYPTVRQAISRATADERLRCIEIVRKYLDTAERLNDGTCEEMARQIMTDMLDGAK